MRNAVLGAFLVAGAIIFPVVAGLTARGGETVAQGPLTLAVDADPTGNTDTSAGEIQSCLAVDPDATFDVDIIVMDVTNLLGWESPFLYDESVIEVTDVNVKLFQAANSNSNIINASEPLPDADGMFFMGAADIGKAVDSGSGVLARLTLRAVGTGISPASLPQLDFNDDGTPDRGPTLAALTFDVVEHPGDVNGDRLFDGPTLHAQIAVGTPCPSGTPPPTTPIASPTGPSDQTPRASQTPEAGLTPGPGQTTAATESPRPGGSLGNSTPGVAPARTGVSSGDGSGLPVWIIAPIIGAVLAIGVGVFGAWRSLRHQTASEDST